MNADAFVALTGIDEENIILSLYAKEPGRGQRLLPKSMKTDARRMVADFRNRQYRFGENGNGRRDHELRQSA